MSTVKNFQEYVKKRIVKKVKPDPIRSNDMIQGAEKSMRHLREIREKIPLTDDNANDLVVHCYNIIMELVRAKLLAEGYKASGFAAHEAEVSYTANLSFSEAETVFLDELRSSRNRIMYYGGHYQKSYASKVLSFIDAVYPKLVKIAKD